MKRTTCKTQSNLLANDWDHEAIGEVVETLASTRSRRTSSLLSLAYRVLVRPVEGERERRQYQEAFENVDILLDWKFVELVLVPLEMLGTCPVCLETPIIPRITACGHLFCYECILAYLLCNHHSQCDEPSKSKRPVGKCPVCNEIIIERELKPVYIEPLGLSNPTVGQFTLMAREAKPTASIALPATFDASLSRIRCFQPYGSVYDGFMRYSLLTKSSFEWWKEFLTQELKYFEREPIVENIKQLAIKNINWKLGSIVQEANKDANDGPNGKSILCNSQSSALNSNTLTYNDVLISVNSFITATNPKDFYFFYQKIDFVNGYSLCLLDPLCIKMLLHQFGSYSKFPPKLPADIPLIERKFVLIEDDSFFRKFKYLSHLPAGTLLCFCLFDLSAVVSDETANLFKSELDAVIQAKHQRNWTENLHSTTILDDHQQMIHLISRSFERTSISTNSPAYSLPPGTPFDDDLHFPAPESFTEPGSEQIASHNPKQKNAWQVGSLLEQRMKPEEFPSLE